MEIIVKRMFIRWYHYDFIFNLTPLAKEAADLANKVLSFTDAVRVILV